MADALLAVLVICLWCLAIESARRAGGIRDAAIVGTLCGGWFAWAWAATQFGLLANPNASPPPASLLVAPGIVITLFIALSGIGRRLAGLNVGLLIGFQAFRIPVELLLAEFHAEGRVPLRMTFHGSNFDIVSGATALVLGLLSIRLELPRCIVIIWNLGGLALLANIFQLALFSAPGTLRRYTDDVPNMLPFVWPENWILFCVFMAFAGHLLVFRRIVVNRE